MEAVATGVKTLTRLVLVIALGVAAAVLFGWTAVALALQLAFPE